MSTYYTLQVEEHAMDVEGETLRPCMSRRDAMERAREAANERGVPIRVTEIRTGGFSMGSSKSWKVEPE